MCDNDNARWCFILEKNKLSFISQSEVRFYFIVGICVAAVKSRPVLHHCVVIFFWSSGIMECTCMLFTFENGVLLMRWGASVVWDHSLLLMNSFNKTEAAVFSCRLCFPWGFPLHQFIMSMTNENINANKVLYREKLTSLLWDLPLL